MAQSHSRVLIHLVFSTQGRAPSLVAEVRRELHPYLASVLKSKGCTPIEVGGMPDHVHLLFGMSRTATIAAVTENLKTSSSKWLKTKAPHLREFSWQNGYGAFSVGMSEVETVSAYIRNQEEHHRRLTFEEEYLAMLEKYGLEADPRYIWK